MRRLVFAQPLLSWFARDVVLPAVRANTGLRELSWLAAWVYGPGMEWNRLPEMQEVTDILHRRVLADWEAAA